MTDREQESAWMLCMMALSGGLNGGGNMAEYISYRDARNAIQANQSALRNAQMRGLQQSVQCELETLRNVRMRELHQSAQANCQTFNPLRMEMEQSYKQHETCKHYDRRNGWCNLMEQPAAVAGSYVLGGKCGMYEYRAPKSQMDAIDAQRAEIDEKLDRIQGAIDRQKEECESMRERLAECCCESEPRSKFRPITADVFGMIEDDVGTVLNRSMSLVVETNRLINEEPRGVLVTESKAFLEDEHGNRVEIGRAPEKKPLTLADLYSLAFPDDPIQAHFEGVYDRIEKECRGRMETLERVRVKPVKCPVRVVQEPDKKISVPKWVVELAQIEVAVLIGSGAAWAICGAFLLAINVFVGTIQTAIEALKCVAILAALTFFGFSVFAILLWGIFKNSEG